MITVLTGENSFEMGRKLRQIAASFDGDMEKVDGSQLELAQLPDLIMGGTLFAEKRLVVVENLSSNKSIWDNFSDWMERIGDTVQLVLLEEKLDKRTKTFKALQKAASVQEFKLWGERDSYQAEQWAIAEAKSLDSSLDKKSAQALVERVGVDQWRLYRALQKLAVLEAITPEVIQEIIEANPRENVFNLLEAALSGDGRRVSQMLLSLQQTEDPYMVFGLLSSQVFNLAVLAVADKPSAEVAKDLGAHPYALSKLAGPAQKLGRSGANRAIDIFAAADQDLKSSVAEPWLLIERALVKLVT